MKNHASNPPAPGESPVKRHAYKIHEAAAALGVKPITIRRLIDRGLLKPCRVLRHVLVPVEQIDALLGGSATK